MYQTEFEGHHHELGTSGLLYRSNKLMYDHETESLWSTLWGEPVVGPLVEQGIQLDQFPVITTTWGQWKQRHPDTTVLSLDTGHRRDYSEGAAYRAYFSHDKPMYAMPTNDDRLKNKAEVLVMRDDNEQIAMAADFLAQHPVYHQQLGDQSFVVLTDASGANWVFESKGPKFVSWNQIDTAVDENGKNWHASELNLTNNEGTVLKRLPAHRAFWFGWHAQFPETRLIK